MLKVLGLCLLLAGCSTLDLAKTGLDLATGGPGKGLSVDTELTVGDKQEAINTQVGGKQEVTAETLTGGVNTTTVNEGPSLLFIGLLILFAGFVIPSPGELWRGIVGAWRNYGK